jgi:sugar phosphate isomerase/epimerase
MEKPFVGLQLYTIRDVANKDAASALQQVKKMGYDFVELAGIYDLDFPQMKELLDNTGLKAASAHVQFAALKENMQEVISAYKSLGCDYIVIPQLESELLPGGSEYNEVLPLLEKFCTICKSEGVTAAYHNHAHEFDILADGEFKLDTLMGDVPGLTAQLDTGWIKAAGQDPSAYIKKYAGRCPIIHFKDTIVGSYNGYEDRPVGKGSQNIPEIIATALAAGAKGFIVELDKPVGQTSLSAAAESRDYLKSLGY